MTTMQAPDSKRGMRVDLQAKLQSVEQERQTIQRRLEHLDRVEQALKLLIAEEHATAALQLSYLPSHGTNGRRTIGNTPISGFLLEALRDGAWRALPLLTQMAEAKGLSFEGKNPARSLHFALIGLARNGYTETSGASVWRLTKKTLSILSPDQPEPAQVNQGVQGNSAAVVGL